VDLFENFGLAHDVHGKHNSCQAYIRATPRTREFVGSLFAFEVLSRFGIGSASVKLRGRRDPYAMVNAIFNAVAKHENIDEFAKDRGKRYLSLKWAYDNSV
jgi:small subunit ribosomal protein S5